MCSTEYIYITNFLLLYFKHNGMSSTKKKKKPIQPICYVMHHQFNIQQLYALPTLYLYVLYLCENKQRLVPLTA